MVGNPSPDGSRQLTIAVNEDTISTAQFGAALAEVARAALCGSGGGEANPSIPAEGSRLGS